MRESSAGYCVVGWAIIVPVGVEATDAMTTVRSRSAPTRCVSLAATSRSKASRQSTPELLAWFEAGTSPRLSRRSLTTGPAFCDSPVWSRPRTTSPSSIAAVPRTWLTVITPVPPMPESRTVKASSGTIGCGAGRPAAASPSMPGIEARAAFGCSSTLTSANEGQSPSRHVRSKLQLVWWMRVLRPYGVSTGCTERQLLLSPQSPQPSHTRSLMTTRNPGLATNPRLRARRFSAAHC